MRILRPPIFQWVNRIWKGLQRVPCVCSNRVLTLGDTGVKQAQDNYPYRSRGSPAHFDVMTLGANRRLQAEQARHELLLGG